MKRKRYEIAAIVGFLIFLANCQGGGPRIAVGGNQDPVPALNAFPSSGQAPLRVQFTSEGSKDPDGRIVLYEWDFTFDGVTFNVEARGPSVTFTYFSPGNYTAALRVIDNLGAGKIDTIRIEVILGTNPPPDVDAKVSIDGGVTFTDGPVSIFRGKTIQFRATGSDPDGGPMTFLWDFGDGTTSTSLFPLKSYSQAGNFLVKVRATDDEGLWAEDAIIVQVSAEWNFPPTADAMVSRDGVSFQEGPIEISVGTLLYFRGMGNDPEDGTNVTYRWDFGDGTEATEQNPLHTFTQSGNFEVIFWVFDRQNNSSTDTVSVRVFSAQNPSVRVQASTDGVNYTETSLVVVPPPGTVHFRAEGTDPLGLPLTYSWDFGDGVSAQGQMVSHSFALRSELYTVRVTVSNTAGGTNTATIRVQVNQPPVARILASPSDAEILYDDAGRAIPVRVNFDGRQSYDPDGAGIVSYEWDFDYRPPTFDPEKTGSTVSKDFDQPGGYIVALRVRDAFGLEDLATTLISMRGNARPVAVILTTPSPPMCASAPCRIDFDASQSTDDTEVDRYQWIFNFNFQPADTLDDLNRKFEQYIQQNNGQPDSSLIRTTYVYTSTGRFYAALRVFDPEGAFHIAVVSVAVAVVTGPPLIEFAGPEEHIMTQADLERGNVQVTLRVVACNPEDVPGFDFTDCKGRGGAGILRYEWDFGDGTPRARGTTLSTVTHTYSWTRQQNPDDPNWLAGYYNITVWVMDREGEVTCWGSADPRCVRQIFRIFVSPFLPERDILSQTPVIDPAPPFHIEDEDGNSFNFCVDPARTQCFSGAIPPNRLDRAIMLHWCFLSSDEGNPEGVMSEWCNRDRMALQFVWTNRDQLPDNDKYQQYFISLDRFTPQQIDFWKDAWGEIYPIAFPILRDMDRNPPSGLDAWESYLPFGLQPGAIPPELDPGSQLARMTVLINRNGNVRFAVVGRDIGLICPAQICGTPRDLTLFDLATHFLKVYQP